MDKGTVINDIIYLKYNNYKSDLILGEHPPTSSEELIPFYNAAGVLIVLFLFFIFMVVGAVNYHNILLLIIGLFLLLFLGYIGYKSWQNIEGFKKIKREGVIVLGEIINCSAKTKEIQSGKNITKTIYLFEIEYKFVSPDENTLFGSDEKIVSHQDYEEANYPSRGTPVGVVYSSNETKML